MEYIRTLETQILDAIGEYGTYLAILSKKVDCSPNLIKKILKSLIDRKIVTESKEEVVLYNYKGQKIHKKLLVYKRHTIYKKTIDDYIRDPK